MDSFFTKLCSTPGQKSEVNLSKYISQHEVDTSEGSSVLQDSSTAHHEVSTPCCLACSSSVACNMCRIVVPYTALACFWPEMCEVASTCFVYVHSLLGFSDRQHIEAKP